MARDNDLYLKYLSVEDVSMFIENIDENEIEKFLPLIYRYILCSVEKFKLSDEDQAT